MTGWVRRPGRGARRGLGVAAVIATVALVASGCLPGLPTPTATSTPTGERVAPGLERYYLDRMDALGITNYRGPRSHSFEFVLGLYMGLQRMDCENVPNVGANSWMVSTWRAIRCDIEPETKRCIIWKGANHLFGLPFLPMRIDRLSPTFPHFVGLKPTRLYNRLAAFYRQRAGL